MVYSLFRLTILIALLLPGARSAVDPRIDVERYVFEIELSDESDVIRGRAFADVLFTQSDVASVALDLVGRKADGTGMIVKSVRIDGADARFDHTGDRLVIRLGDSPMQDDRRTFDISYEGNPADGLIISTNKYGDRTFFGDNWPDRARHWLPVVDHPSDKAYVEFIVTAPDHYQVVGSGRLVEETDLPNGRRRTHWRSSRPMATKVAVIGAARFAVEYVDEVDGVSVQSWVYPQDRDEGFFDYALAEPVLRFFEGRLGDFPYAKLASVQSKTRYGGMENASNIFYSERSVTGTRSSENLIAHEVAHQWFGDSVTEADWPHIWLSEGFATYLTALYVEHAYGEDRFIELMKQNRQTVIEFSKRVSLPVLQDPPPSDLIQLLTPNSYQKGGWVLHMLRNQIGTEVFWDGLRTYYARYRDGNASTDDFRHVMEDVSGQDLRWFFDQWLKRPVHPVFEGTWSYDPAAGSVSVVLRQVQTGTVFRVPLDIGLVGESAPEMQIVSVEIDERTERFSLATELPALKDVVLDPGADLLMEGSLASE